jgi:hypothetical protein
LDCYSFFELPSQAKIPPPNKASAMIPITTFMTVALFGIAFEEATFGVDVIAALCAKDVEVGKPVDVEVTL